MYQKTIQETIQYIEENLHENLTLDSIAQFASFSKFHFHRVFLKEVGKSVMEYVRNRRIANSSYLLLYSEMKIIDIAFYYRFETQESFTRAFKKVYQLPPGQYRKIISKVILLKEESILNNEQTVKGWILSGSHPYHYEIGMDRKVFHTGSSSGYIMSKAVVSSGEFGTMMQEFKAEKYRGKRMKLSGFLKSSGIDGFCGFWMRVDNSVGDVLQFDNMGDRPITSDLEWNHYFIVLDVPETSSMISFGVLLSGNGHVWIDDLKFEEVDDRTPTTNIDFTKDVREEPLNLSFEEG